GDLLLDLSQRCWPGGSMTRLDNAGSRPGAGMTGAAASFRANRAPRPASRAFVGRHDHQPDDPWTRRARNDAPAEQMRSMKSRSTRAPNLADARRQRWQLRQKEGPLGAQCQPGEERQPDDPTLRVCARVGNPEAGPEQPA